jgi:hypothetical protein
VALVAVVPLLVVLVHPRSLGAVLALGSRLLPGRLPVERIPGRTLVQAQLWTLAAWSSLSVHIGVLAVAAGAPVDWSTLLVAISGYPLAWLVGFVVVVAPAGAGAREAALIAVLSVVLDPTSALAVALVSRIVTILGDVVPAAVAVAAGGLRRSSPTPVAGRGYGDQADQGPVGEADG